MSKILEQGTVFNDIECLHQAVTESGLTAICTDNYSMVTMEGYTEQFQAELGIRKANFREVTGQFTYGDLGFSRTEDGSFKLTADDILVRSSAFGTFYDAFSVKYAEKKYVKDMFQQGFALSSSVAQTDGSVHLEFAEIGLG